MRETKNDSLSKRPAKIKKPKLIFKMSNVKCSDSFKEDVKQSARTATQMNF